MFFSHQFKNVILKLVEDIFHPLCSCTIQNFYVAVKFTQLLKFFNFHFCSSEILFPKSFLTLFFRNFSPEIFGSAIFLFFEIGPKCWSHYRGIATAERVKIIFIFLAWDLVRKRNRNPGCRWEKERERGRENDGTRMAWDAHVRSQGRSGAINRSGRFISRRAATAATRFRECSQKDLVQNEQLLSSFFAISIL